MSINLEKIENNTIIELFDFINNNNTNDNNNLICQNITKRILSSEYKNTLQLLELLKNIAKNDSDNNPLEQYSELVENNVSLFSVVKKLVRVVRGLPIELDGKIKLTSYIWSCRSFRKVVPNFQFLSDGKEYCENSIFSSVTTKDKLITDIVDPGTMETRINSKINMNDVVKSFNPLIIDSDTRSFLIKYLKHIIECNIGYCHDNCAPDRMKRMSSFDYCVLCFNILIEIVKIEIIKTETTIVQQDLSLDIIQLFWQGINVIHFTSAIITNSIGKDINMYNDRIRGIPDGVDDKTKKSLKIQRDSGILMMLRLHSYIMSVDEEFIDKTMLNQMQLLIDTKNDNLMMRMITFYSFKKEKDMNKSYIASILYKLMKETYVSVYVKFECVKLLMSHRLKIEFFNIPESSDVLANYIINEVYKIKDIYGIHLVTMMTFLKDTIVMKRPDVLELYMSNLSGFIEQYVEIINVFNVIDADKKPYVLNDIVSMLNSSTYMIRNLNIIEDNARSYLNDILCYINTINNSKQLLKQDELRNITDEEKKDMNTFFDDLQKNYIIVSKECIADLFKNLEECDIIINKESHKVLVEVLNIEINTEKIKIIDTVPDHLMDVITYDLVVNPFYIQMSNGDLQLIDRKTMLSISRKMVHPFTREPIDIDTLIEFNNREHIRIKREEVLIKLQQLYDML